MLLRVGKTIGGVAGALKVNCRNRANSAIFNTDAMLPGTSGVTTGTTINWWDTMNDFNNNGAFPSSLDFNSKTGANQVLCVRP